MKRGMRSRTIGRRAAWWSAPPSLTSTAPSDEHREQAVEVAGLGGDEEGGGDLPRVLVGGLEARAILRTRRRAREAICRQASGDLSTTAAISSNG